jgi:hypothetical protein
LNHTPVRLPFQTRVLPSRLLSAVFFASFAASAAHAQIAGAPSDLSKTSGINATSQPALTSEAMLSLPDAPGSYSSSRVAEDVSAPSAVENFDAAFQNFPPSTTREASHTDKYIAPGQIAPRLSASDKVKMGIKDAISPLSAVGWLVSAGYSQGVNGSPNYGTNATAFAQRFGAAAARAGSEGMFSDSIMAPVFHEDPRYYKMGSGHNFFKRVGYSITRPLLTRTDGGHQTINLAYLSGNLAGSFLTQAYYPPVNRGVSQVMQTYGGSIGGGALGFFVSEFLDDTLQALHLEHKK